ncbi:MAG: hypothetical protein IKS87_05075 [Lachnospiraceae bacterium]|nr:hypothetical protein [Lachnospiraceae bacterium]
MIALKITNVKRAMNLLLNQNETAFDAFLVSSVRIVTNVSVTIDGHLQKEFYTSEELEEMQREAENEGRVFSTEMVRYARIRQKCFDLIKGSKTPLAFVITFYLAGENVERFLSGIDTTLTLQDVAGLSLNLKYENDELIATCATSLRTFTADRSVERAWDSMVKKFFDRQEIAYEEL